MKKFFLTWSQIPINFTVQTNSKTTTGEEWTFSKKLYSWDMDQNRIKALSSSFNPENLRTRLQLNFMSSVKTHRKQYQRITFAKRLKLIELVVEKRLSICRAAVATEIALSTAKIIIKRFREKGTIFVRKEEQKLSKKSEEMSQIFEANESQQALVENPGSNGQNIPFMPYLTYIPPAETFLVFYSPEIFFDSAFSGFARLQ